MAVQLETYRTSSVQGFVDKDIKPKIIRIKGGLDSQSNTRIIAYEFTIHGTYFRVPRVRVAFVEDIDGPLFDDNTNNQIDAAVLRFKLRQDKQRNDGLSKPIS